MGFLGSEVVQAGAAMHLRFRELVEGGVGIPAGLVERFACKLSVVLDALLSGFDFIGYLVKDAFCHEEMGCELFRRESFVSYVSAVFRQRKNGVEGVIHFCHVVSILDCSFSA